MRRRVVTAVIAVVALSLVAVLLVRHQRRENEWAHGGDGFEPQVAVEVYDRASQTELFDDFARGIYAGVEPIAPEAVRVRLTWDGPVVEGATYGMVLLDRRYETPEPLSPYGAEPDDEATVHWDGRYDELGEHCDWVHNTLPVKVADGYADRALALGFAGTELEAVDGVFKSVPGAPPVTDPGRELIVAVFLFDGDEVRWAKQLPVSS